MEKVINIFQPYLKDNQYLDIVWSDKLGYILMKINQKHRAIMESLIMKDVESLVKELFEEIATDVIVLTGNEHRIEEVDPLEKAEIERRLAVYIEQLPEYANIKEKMFQQ